MIIGRRTVLAGSLMAPLFGGQVAAQMLNARDHGVRGDGETLDHNAINRLIADLSRAGGGTLILPAGRYLCFSIRLRSNVGLVLSPGAIIVAADPARDGGRYDLPETNSDDFYQDFGHSHWQNSLIWGDGIENASILGEGLIDGSRGLTRNGPGARWQNGVGSSPLSLRNLPKASATRLEQSIARMSGQGNKAIALKNCRNVLLRDFKVLNGGHFAVLATGVDHLTIDNLLIDTNRDGLDIDACRDVHITNCTVNSPNDDGICLKSSVALGTLRPTENVTVANCTVSGFNVGTVLDGTYGRTQLRAPDLDGVTGRIKLGTESSGGFRNIAISNCVFDRCRGLALETVDGAALEDVTIDNLVMRDLTTAPIFLRLGDRHRTPAPTATLAALRRVTISNVTASGIDHRYAATIAGLPEAPVEDVYLSNIQLNYAGGGIATDPERPIPEERSAYPEPSMFGISPAYGFYIRHARRIRIDGLMVSAGVPEDRPALLFDDAQDVRVTRFEGKGEQVVTNTSRDVKITS